MWHDPALQGIEGHNYCIHTCDMFHTYVWHAYVWHAYVWHAYMCHDSFTCYRRVLSGYCVHTCDMTQTYVRQVYTWHESFACYGVATISRLLKVTGLFCRISSLLEGSFTKETYDFKEPTDRSHTIPEDIAQLLCSHVWHDSCVRATGICVTWLNHMLPEYIERLRFEFQTLLPTLHFSLLPNESRHTYEFRHATWHVNAKVFGQLCNAASCHVSRVTHMHYVMPRDMCSPDSLMGWLRWVGSFKL